MTTFLVPDMTCGHCTSTITKAVNAVDPAAGIQFDLPTHRVDIQSSKADADVLRKTIADAGYTPEPFVGESAQPAAAARRGCCCG
jgi:copper chaperone